MTDYGAASDLVNDGTSLSVPSTRQPDPIDEQRDETDTG